MIWRRYNSISTLPPGVRNSLPKDAQRIYKTTYNSALREHSGEADPGSTAHRIAWSKVKRLYEKLGEHWVRKNNNERRWHE